MDIPKYAKLENERRFLVDPARAPSVEGQPYRLIEDRYIDGARLRLRMATHKRHGRPRVQALQEVRLRRPAQRAHR